MCRSHHHPCVVPMRAWRKAEGGLAHESMPTAPLNPTRPQAEAKRAGWMPPLQPAIEDVAPRSRLGRLEGMSDSGGRRGAVDGVPHMRPKGGGVSPK